MNSTARTPLKKQILCISFSNITKDSRVLRQISVLKKLGEVHTVGYGSAPEGSSSHTEIPQRLKSLPETPLGVLKLALRLFQQVELKAPAEAEALAQLKGQRYDLIVANDARALPLAFALKGEARIWLDLHEWAIEENSTNTIWKLLVSPYMDSLCKRYLPLVDAVSTVNDSIAKLYLERYGKLPTVIRNSNFFQNLQPIEVDPTVIKLVHSGIAVPERNIEALIEAVLQLGDGFSLDLYLIADREGAYYKKLFTLANDHPRIRFKDPVAPNRLVAELNKYDLGVYLLKPQSLNHSYMLPNKLFDYIQARLGILFSDSIEISNLVETYQIGKIVAEPKASDLINSLHSLTVADIMTMKHNADKVARQLSFEADSKVIETLASEALI